VDEKPILFKLERHKFYLVGTAPLVVALIKYEQYPSFLILQATTTSGMKANSRSPHA